MIGVFHVKQKKGGNPLQESMWCATATRPDAQYHNKHLLVNTSIITTPLTWVWREDSGLDFQKITHVNCSCSGGDLWGFVRPNSWMRKLKPELFFLLLLIYLCQLYLFMLYCSRDCVLYFWGTGKSIGCDARIFECTFAIFVHCVRGRRFSTTKYDMFSLNVAVWHK